MRRLLRCTMVLALASDLAAEAGAQSDPTRPFAEYPERSAAYLRRIHAKNSNDVGGDLAFREDYPGGFKAWQKAARAELELLLGLDRIRDGAREHRPLVQWGPITDEDGYTRQRADIETEPGVTIPFWLLRPVGESGEQRPLAVCTHGHDSDGWNTYAGVYRDKAHRDQTLAKDGDVGVQAVRRGFVVLVPATRGLAEITHIPDLKGRHGNRPCRAQLVHCLLAGRTAVGERVWDMSRIIDWAAELPEVNADNLLMMGNSGGGVVTMYAAACDERITIAVPSCSFSVIASREGRIYHCDCCAIPGILRWGEIYDVCGLIAPGHLLAVNGVKDTLHTPTDVDRSAVPKDYLNLLNGICRTA